MLIIAFKQNFVFKINSASIHSNFAHLLPGQYLVFSELHVNIFYYILTFSDWDSAPNMGMLRGGEYADFKNWHLSFENTSSKICNTRLQVFQTIRCQVLIACPYWIPNNNTSSKLISFHVHHVTFLGKGLILLTLSSAYLFISVTFSCNNSSVKNSFFKYPISEYWPKFGGCLIHSRHYIGILKNSNHCPKNVFLL